MSIRVEHISYIYGKGSPFEKTALDDVDLTIEKGEFIGIIGHTGSGKSTLIQHLNGLIHPTCGKVTIDGVDLAEKSKAAVAKRQSAWFSSTRSTSFSKKPSPKTSPSGR